MRGYEFTDRGKIVMAFFVVVVILVFALVLSLLAFAGNSPEELSEEPSASANQETVSLPALSESPQPPESDDFLPPPDNNDPEVPSDDDPLSGDIVSDDSSDDIISDDPNDDSGYDFSDVDSSADNEADVSPSPLVRGPVLNLSTGRFSFFFSPQAQTYLDGATSNVLNTFLNMPSNIPDNMIAIEIPMLSREDREHFMSVITSALGERNIDSQRITRVENPETPHNGHFEVVMYFIVSQGK